MPGDAVPEPAPQLEGGEELLTVLRGIGSVMFLTSARLIVARHGLERRPRSGIQAFALGDIREIRIERGSGPSGRVVVSTGRDQEVVSMFFEPRSLDVARELIAAARLQITRLRRIGAKGSEGPTGLIGRS